MKNVQISSLTLLLCFTIQAQSDNIQAQLDSVLQEANLLYRYERAAWVASDMIMERPAMREKAGGYTVYRKQDTVHAIFTDRKQKNRIARFSFTGSDPDAPASTDYKTTKLTPTEKKRLQLLNKLGGQLNKNAEKYQISIPQNCNPNLVLMQADNGYKLYIMMGTTKNVTPLGNDYLFTTDREGNITSHKRFHNSYLAIDPSAAGDGSKTISSVHSHLEKTPLITATDICIFKLYKESHGMNKLFIMSTAHESAYIYDLNDNSISIRKIGRKF